MKKAKGICSRCGETMVGIKSGGWRGSKASKHLFHPEKAGNVKCLSCQRCDNVKIVEIVE